MKYPLIFITGLAFLINACRTPADIDLEDIDDKIVLNSIYSPDSCIKIYLQNQYSVLDGGRADNPEYLKQAEVYLYEDNVPVDTLQHTIDAEYISEIYPKIGSKYSVDVHAQGYPSVHAEDIVPETVPIDTVTYERFSYVYYHAYQHKIFISFTDPPGKNYYMFYDIDSNGSQSTDPVIDEYKPKHGYNIIFAFNDELFDGQTYELEIISNLSSYWNREEGAVLRYKLHSISEEFYTFCKSVNAQSPKHTDDIFELYSSGITEPVLIYSNVEDGLGIFGGYSTAIDSLFIPGSDLINTP
ncbi:MAG: DUF4249 domain-containing protein [Bacteroidota bacterium]|nr:DUF4249 domain-containing protein [Bacteroidota bacterium]